MRSLQDLVFINQLTKIKTCCVLHSDKLEAKNDHVNCLMRCKLQPSKDTVVGASKYESIENGCPKPLHEDLNRQALIIGNVDDLTSIAAQNGHT